MDFDSPDKNVRCTPRKTRLHFYPVFPGDSGEGLPYAPEDWPNPGDKWRWKAGKRVIGSGYIWDRYLYLPSRLEKAGQPKSFRSKISVERYVQSTFPGTDMNAFFSSFMWNIPLKQFNSKELLGSDSHLSHTCKAGNNKCISLSVVSDPPLSEAMFCDICCSEPDFCRNCCCILCSKTICSAFGSYNYIRCKAILLDGCICGHIAHLDCAQRAHMVGTVGGSYDLDVEYFCRRCDSRTDLVSHIMELLQICESIDSREEIEMIFNSAISILQGSKKLNARQLLHRIESGMAKLKNGANFEDVWKKEEATLEVITARPPSMSSFRERLERVVARGPVTKRQKVTAQPGASSSEPGAPPPGGVRPQVSHPPVLPAVLPTPPPPPRPPAERTTRSLPAIIREALRTLEGWAVSTVALVEDEQGRARELVRALEAETRRADEAVRRDAESRKALQAKRKRHAEELGQVIPAYRKSDEFERDAEEYVRGHCGNIVASWLASDAGKETIAEESAMAFQVGRYAMQHEIYTALRQKGDAFDPVVLELPAEMENPEPVNPAAGFSLSPLDRADEPVELVASSGGYFTHFAERSPS